MTKKSLFGGPTLDTTTSAAEDLRQSLNGCSREWREAVLTELARRGEPFVPSHGHVSGIDDVPISPYPTRNSPWNSAPGTPARHDEEEESIHGVN